MKFTIETEDETEAKRLAKSLDMALFIFQIKHNLKFIDKGGSYSDAVNDVFEAINNELTNYSIDIEDLVQ